MNKNDAGVIVAGNSLRGPGRPPGGAQGGRRDDCRPHLPVPRCRRGQLRLYGLIYIIYCSSVNYLTSSFSKFWIMHGLLFLVKLTRFCCLLAVAEADGADRHLGQGLHVYPHLSQLPVRIRTMAGATAGAKERKRVNYYYRQTTE